MRAKTEPKPEADDLPADWKFTVLILIGSFSVSFGLQVLVPVFGYRSTLAIAAMKAAEYYHGIVLIAMAINSIGRLITGGWLFRCGFAVIFGIGLLTLFVLPTPTVTAIAQYADSKQIIVKGTVTKVTQLEWGKGTEVEYQYSVNGRSYSDYAATKRLWEPRYKKKVKPGSTVKIKASGTIPWLNIVKEEWAD